MQLAEFKQLLNNYWISTKQLMKIIELNLI